MFLYRRAFPSSQNNRGLCCAYSYLESIEVHIKCTLHALKHLKHSKPINLLTKYPPQFDFFSALKYYIFTCNLQSLTRASYQREERNRSSWPLLSLQKWTWKWSLTAPSVSPYKDFAVFLSVCCVTVCWYGFQPWRTLVSLRTKP